MLEKQRFEVVGVVPVDAAIGNFALLFFFALVSCDHKVATYNIMLMV